MPSITPEEAAVFDIAGGVDTHQDTHTAAVIDLVGRVLGTQQFPATAPGYAALLAWMRGFGQRMRVEGTGAYGAGLARVLRDEGVDVIEVDRPDRKTRRFQGKSDPQPPRQPWPATGAVSPSGVTAVLRRYVTCGWPGAARSTSAPTPSGRSKP
jgi:hypothetical protein